MKDWQPRLAVNGSLKVEEELVHMEARCSEGDTLEIDQKLCWLGNEQSVTLDRHELYDIIFNFMSTEELQVLLAERQKLEFERRRAERVF